MTRTLLIARHMPQPASSGAAQRTDILLRALASLGEADLVVLAPPADLHDTHPACVRRFETIPLTPGKVSPYPALRRISPTLARVRYALSLNYGFYPIASVVQRVKEIIDSGNYDHIVVRYLSTFGHCGLEGRSNVIVDIDDLPAESFRTIFVDTESSAFKRAFMALRLQGMKAHTRRLVAKCQHVWLANPDQAAMFSNGSCLPNIPYPFSERVTRSGSSAERRGERVIFVGAMDYFPNQEAVAWFARKVWPSVARAMPSAEFIVIGGGCPSALKAELESCAGIVCAGYVADLTIQYQSASLAVAPILSGGGTSIKVLEALSYGIPCVMTTFAGRGLAQMLPASFTQLIAGDAEDFARLTLLMLRDPALRESAGDNLRGALDEHFSYAAVLREAASVLAQARDTA